MAVSFIGGENRRKPPTTSVIRLKFIFLHIGNKDVEKSKAKAFLREFYLSPENYKS